MLVLIFYLFYLWFDFFKILFYTKPSRELLNEASYLKPAKHDAHAIAIKLHVELITRIFFNLYT